MKKIQKTTIFLLIFFFFLPTFIFADYLGQINSFFIEPLYDLFSRQRITATLRYISQNLYFYVEDSWWNYLTYQRQEEIKRILTILGSEFDYKIYPSLTSLFGSEPKPGIDNDPRITVLIHQINPSFGGYFNTGDLYSQIQYSTSNQREMIYLNAKYIDELLAKIHLGHEFVHLITFNQKEKTYGVSEDVWLNEGRAEYAPTLLGYDELYGSNLSKRINTFLENPSDPLCEWKNKPSDYGVVNIFVQYLVDHYGTKILVDSLKSSKIGIASINEALKKSDIKKNFSNIFEDWVVASYLNDCQLGIEYCFLNPSLKGLRVSPSLYFLPQTGNGTFSVFDSTKDWTGNWYKVVGGKDNLKFQFKGDPLAKFKVIYILEKKDGKKEIKSLYTNNKGEGQIIVPNFGSEITSFVFIPIAQAKTSNFSSLDPSYNFWWSVATTKEIFSEKETPPQQESALSEKDQELQQKISFLQSEIERILKEFQKIQSNICQKFERDLYFGLKNDNEVRCLQLFLKNQGPEIYPEGLITGNFLNLTKKAVMRFQEKYKEEILYPLGLNRPTGYVGFLTRQKINQLISF